VKAEVNIWDLFVSWVAMYGRTDGRGQCWMQPSTRWQQYNAYHSLTGATWVLTNFGK